MHLHSIACSCRSKANTAHAGILGMSLYVAPTNTCDKFARGFQHVIGTVHHAKSCNVCFVIALRNFSHVQATLHVQVFIKILKCTTAACCLES